MQTTSLVPPTYRMLLSRGGFCAFFANQILTNLGEGLLASVIVASAVAAGAKPVGLGFVTFCTVLPRGLLAPIGGVIADRMEAAGVLRWLELARFLAVVLASLLIGVAGLSLALLAVLGFAVASLFSISYPVGKAYMPRLIPADELQLANGAIQAVIWPCYLIGAGLLTAGEMTIGLSAMYYVSAGIFLASLICLLFVPADRREIAVSSVTLRAFKRDLVTGYQALAGHQALHARVFLYGVYTFAWRGMLQVGLPLLLVAHGDPRAALFGVLSMVSGAGELAGNIVVGKLRLERPVVTAFLGEAVLGGAIIGIAAGMVLHAPAAFLFVCMALFGTSACLIDVPVMTAIQQQLGPRDTGKAVACWGMIGSAGGAMGTFGIGLMLNFLPFAPALIGLGVLLLVVSFGFWRWAGRLPACAMSAPLPAAAE